MCIRDRFSQDEFYKKVKEQQKVIVDVSFHGKTALSVGFYLPGALINVNSKLETETFSFKEVSSYSYFTYKTVVNQFFKISKKQGLNEFIQHVKNLINYFLESLIIDVDNFQIVVWKTKPIQKLLLDNDKK